MITLRTESPAPSPGTLRWASRTSATTLVALPVRERLILRLRFDRDMTQGEIAQELGMSQMHVSRLLRRSLGKLRQVASARAVPA